MSLSINKWQEFYFRSKNKRRETKHYIKKIVSFGKETYNYLKKYS